MRTTFVCEVAWPELSPLGFPPFGTFAANKFRSMDFLPYGVFGVRKFRRMELSPYGFLIVRNKIFILQKISFI